MPRFDFKRKGKEKINRLFLSTICTGKKEESDYIALRIKGGNKSERKGQPLCPQFSFPLHPLIKAQTHWVDPIRLCSFNVHVLTHHNNLKSCVLTRLQLHAFSLWSWHTLTLCASPEVWGKNPIGINSRTSVCVQKALPLHNTLDESGLIFGAVFHYGIRPL